MSTASVHHPAGHPAELRSNTHNSIISTLSHSLDDVTLSSTTGGRWSPLDGTTHYLHPYQQHPGYHSHVHPYQLQPSAHTNLFPSEHVMTIEELRCQMSSCLTCGVSWSDSHVSLDCSECGGYALERPCPVCEGQCGAIWKRDLSLSHSSNKARWEGQCYNSNNNNNNTNHNLKTVINNNNIVKTTIIHQKSSALSSSSIPSSPSQEHLSS